MAPPRVSAVQPFTVEPVPSSAEGFGIKVLGLPPPVQEEIKSAAVKINNQFFIEVLKYVIINILKR